MLDVVDREYVKGLLAQRVSVAGAPRQVLVSTLPQDIAQQVEEGLTPINLVERVLVLCEADGWRRAPSTLSSLLNALLGPTGNIPTILIKLATPPAAVATNDAFTTSILDNGQPFLDRLETRATLRSWTEEVMPIRQVMVVEGASKTGKTYTVEFARHLVRHAARNDRNVRAVLVTLDREQAASCGQAELAIELVSEMGGDPSGIPTKDTNTVAWTKQLVTWVLREANRQGLHWWFLLDGFRSSLPGEEPKWQLREDTRDFIVGFVKGLANGINPSLHRLLLLDFDRSILPLRPGSLGLESTNAIPHASIRTLVRSIIGSVGADADPAAIEAEIVTGFPDPVQDLPELNTRLMEFMGMVR